MLIYGLDNQGAKRLQRRPVFIAPNGSLSKNLR
jgi:hypothetical protein